MKWGDGRVVTLTTLDHPHRVAELLPSLKPGESEKMRRNLSVMFVLVVGLLTTYQALVRGTVLPVPAENLVVNGSFEDGYPGDNICGSWWHEVGYNCEPSGTIIPGWTETADG